MVSKELQEFRDRQMNEVCPNQRSNGNHCFVFNHWCHCDPPCEDNVHRQCEYCGTSEENGCIDD